MKLQKLHTTLQCASKCSITDCGQLLSVVDHRLWSITFCGQSLTVANHRLCSPTDCVHSPTVVNYCVWSIDDCVHSLTVVTRWPCSLADRGHSLTVVNQSLTRGNVSASDLPLPFHQEDLTSLVKEMDPYLPFLWPGPAVGHSVVVSSLGIGQAGNAYRYEIDLKVRC